MIGENQDRDHRCQLARGCRQESGFTARTDCTFASSLDGEMCSKRVKFRQGTESPGNSRFVIFETLAETLDYHVGARTKVHNSVRSKVHKLAMKGFLGRARWVRFRRSGDLALHGLDC